MAADILQSLRKDILSGEFTSGEKLSEKSLSDRYGVSRTPVREALIHLAAEGLTRRMFNLDREEIPSEAH